LLLDVQLALKIIGIGTLVFLFILLGMFTFGFGPAGIIAGSPLFSAFGAIPDYHVSIGSAAAGIQSAVFGAAVPAGSWFAVMTSLGMTGGFIWIAAALSRVIMAFLVWHWKPFGAKA
jgi:hypothetical protein